MVNSTNNSDVNILKLIIVFYFFKDKELSVDILALYNFCIGFGWEISLIDYMLEISIYFESKTKVLEMEKELRNTLAELNQYM